jgi:hypothetical protein
LVLRLKTLWGDGARHLVMSPLAFMQRLAAPMTPPGHVVVVLVAEGQLSGAESRGL